MEKLFKLVCANFALLSKDPLKCSKKFEDNDEDALVAFVGLSVVMYGTVQTMLFLDTNLETINLYRKLYEGKKIGRFNTKLSLIRNGLKL